MIREQYSGSGSTYACNALETTEKTSTATKGKLKPNDTDIRNLDTWFTNAYRKSLENNK